MGRKKNNIIEELKEKYGEAYDIINFFNENKLKVLDYSNINSKLVIVFDCDDNHIEKFLNKIFKKTSKSYFIMKGKFIKEFNVNEVTKGLTSTDFKLAHKYKYYIEGGTKQNRLLKAFTDIMMFNMYLGNENEYSRSITKCIEIKNNLKRGDSNE